MLDRIIVNTIYLVPLHIRNFKKQHPNTRVIIADGTKARRVKSNAEAKYEMGWVTARRNVLILTEDALYCSDWTIPLSSIVEAQLIYITGGSILKISTADDLNYQFGMQRNPIWEEQKVLPLTVQNTALSFSKPSFIFRMLMLAWLVYLFVRDYLQNGLSLWSLLYLVLFLWIIVPLISVLRISKSDESTRS